MGCLDLDALRERAGTGMAAADGGDMDATCQPEAGSCACGSDVRMLRLWKLHLGSEDYVTLRNTSPCAIELGGVRLFFDDHSELFPDAEVDCLVQLPAFSLQAGAEVRVHEVPRPGDIGALENKLSGCGYDLSFNPDRGGVTYVCDGKCDPERVIDMVVHVGEKLGPPALRYGKTLDTPLSGVTVATQDIAQYRRVASAKKTPALRDGGWELETRYIYAGFENAIEVLVDGTTMSWVPEEGQSATVSSVEISAVGQRSLSLTHRGGDGRSDGLALPLPDGLGTPTHVSYHTRIDALPAAGAYFDLKTGDFSAIQASFEASGLGTEIEDQARTDIVTSARVFHQVEFRNLDWDAHTYDLYIDRVLIQAGQRFWSNAVSVDRLALYSISSGSVVYWDEIELWRSTMPVEFD